MLTERERRNGGKKQQQYKLGKEVKLKESHAFKRRENKVRGREEHGGSEKAAQMRKPKIEFFNILF